MTDAKKKISQSELRQLMREKAQHKITQRIDSPLAKYDDENNLWCVVCNIIIQLESRWSTHLVDKTHKKVKLLLAEA